MATSLSREFVRPPPFPGEHKYDGIMFPALIREDTLDALKTWECREDDIFVVTYPKSGTHWIFEIVSLITNGGDPSKIECSHQVTGLELTIANLNMTTALDAKAAASEKAGYELIDDWESPRVIPSHVHERHMPPDVWKRKAKVVYLGRNYKDVCCSAAAFTMPLLPPVLQDFDNLIRNYLLNNDVAMGTWFEHVRGYEMRLNDDNFLFLKYEDLQKDLVGEVKKIAKFLGRPLSDEQAEKVAHFASMGEMRKSYDKHEAENPEGYKHTRAFGQLKFLNKGKVGNWKDKITGDLNALFDEVYQEKMAGSSLQFQFEI